MIQSLLNRSAARRRLAGARRAEPSATRSAVEAALAKPDWVVFQNSAGGREYLSIRAMPIHKDHLNFEVWLGTSTLTVSVARTMPHPHAALARALDLFSQLPQDTRYPLRTLKLETGADPFDAYFQAKYHDPSLVGGSSARGSTVTIWHAATNLYNLRPRRLDHEIGHLIGMARSQDRTFCPPGWHSAITADGPGNAVSAYARVNPDEDFTESWSFYILARQQGPQVLAGFRQRYPHRSALLDEIYADVVRRGSARGKGSQLATPSSSPSASRPLRAAIKSSFGSARSK